MADLKQQVGAMNTKIDSILRILETMSHPVGSAEAVKQIIPPKADIIQKDFPKKIAAKKRGPAKR